MRAYVHNTKLQTGTAHIKLLLLVAAAVILVGSAAFFLINRREPTAADTGDTFAAALSKQDVAASYNLLADESKKQTTQEDWEVWVQFIFDDYGDQKPELVQESPITNLGNVYKAAEKPTRMLYEFDLKDGRYTLPLVLVYQHNEWKIKEIGSFQE